MFILVHHLVDVTVISNDINNSKGVAIYIASLKNGKFRFFGNRTHDSQNDSVLLYLTNYIPASIEGGLYGNSFDKPINIYGTLQMDLSLKKDLYHVGGDLKISAGKTLTIAEGSTLAFLSSSASTVTVGGV